MRDKVLRCIRDNGLLQEGDSVLVALSGGADSVSLLHLLISVKESFNIKLSALHMNHMIRGEEANRDERFCRDLCDRLGVALEVVTADVPALAAESGESVELCGRRMRYAALIKAADALGGAKIATAHNRNDNTETVVMNLVRGAGLAGLSGIPVKRDSIIRPLLNCSREEIEAYCLENHLNYVTDSTNLSDEYTRNKLRLHILPALRELNPSLDEGVRRTASIMRDADDYLRKISLSELNKSKTTYGYDCARLLALDRIVLTYAMMQAAEESGAPSDFRRISLVIEAMRGGGAVDLGQGFRAECTQGILRIVKQKGSDADEMSIPFARFGAVRCDMETIRSTYADENGKINKKFLNRLIPCDIITDDTVVRHRRAGDTFTDPRRGVTKTLKKLFNELKIPREKRDGILVAANGDDVLWIQGVGTSRSARIEEDYQGKVYIMDN